MLHSNEKLKIRIYTTTMSEDLSVLHIYINIIRLGNLIIIETLQTFTTST